jgi:small-conductance mechanosensitive channel
VGVAYGSDPQEVIDLLVEVAREHPEISQEPEPIAFFISFGESSLDFKLLTWTTADKWFRVSSDLRVATNHALKEAGIRIPFPQRDFHLRSIDEGISLSAAGRKE